MGIARGTSLEWILSFAASFLLVYVANNFVGINNHALLLIIFIFGAPILYLIIYGIVHLINFIKNVIAYFYKHLPLKQRRDKLP
jgi:hypothetical protein